MSPEARAQWLVSQDGVPFAESHNIDPLYSVRPDEWQDWMDLLEDIPSSTAADPVHLVPPGD